MSDENIKEMDFLEQANKRISELEKIQNDWIASLLKEQEKREKEIAELRKMLTDMVGSDNVWMTNTMEAIKFNTDQLNELKEHDIFKIWDSARRGGKATLHAILHEIPNIKEVLRELIDLAYHHYTLGQLFGDAHKYEELLAKLDVRSAAHTEEKGIPKWYHLQEYECDFTPKETEKKDSELVLDHDTGIITTKRVMDKLKASGGEKTVARVKEHKSDYAVPIEAVPCKPTTDSKPPERILLNKDKGCPDDCKFIDHGLKTDFPKDSPCPTCYNSDKYKPREDDETLICVMHKSEIVVKREDLQWLCDQANYYYEDDESLKLKKIEEDYGIK